MRVSKRLLGDGLVTSEGDYHDRQRKIIQPAFHPNLIKKYGEIMTTFANDMSRNWVDGRTVDIHREMIKVTSAIISKAVLGSDINTAEGDEVGDSLLISCRRTLIDIIDSSWRIDWKDTYITN